MASQLVVFVPDTHLQQVKDALFAAGAGAQGDYQQCAWQVLGRGQFRPMKSANPFIGQALQLSQVDEWRLEMMVADGLQAAVRQALLQAHPYEEPAYYFLAHSND